MHDTHKILKIRIYIRDIMLQFEGRRLSIYFGGFFVELVLEFI